jgi:hypothetical protein
MAVRLQDLGVGRSTGTARAIDDVEPAQPMRLEEATRLQSARCAVFFVPTDRMS